MSEEHQSADLGELARLRAQVADYQTRMTDASTLVAQIRHDINNPLSGVIGQAQLLLRDELSDAARRRVVTIEQLASRIRDTVAKLRDIQTPVPTPNRVDE